MYYSDQFFLSSLHISDSINVNMIQSLTSNKYIDILVISEQKLTELLNSTEKPFEFETPFNMIYLNTNIKEIAKLNQLLIKRNLDFVFNIYCSNVPEVILSTPHFKILNSKDIKVFNLILGDLKFIGIKYFAVLNFVILRCALKTQTK